ncbi:hypothetical protein GCM10009682_62150 [Luedemannella flava]|uniref:Uncharacterized protein n=1 Tax=Luedemannella flava TaxID=349316 RepID=A0ABP4Z3W1_9ACTN
MLLLAGLVACTPAPPERLALRRNGSAVQLVVLLCGMERILGMSISEVDGPNSWSVEPPDDGYRTTARASGEFEVRDAFETPQGWTAASTSLTAIADDTRYSAMTGVVSWKLRMRFDGRQVSQLKDGEVLTGSGDDTTVMSEADFREKVLADAEKDGC